MDKVSDKVGAIHVAVGKRGIAELINAYSSGRERGASGV
jgi:hypothetical protein